MKIKTELEGKGEIEVERKVDVRVKDIANIGAVEEVEPEVAC